MADAAIDLLPRDESADALLLGAPVVARLVNARRRRRRWRQQEDSNSIHEEYTSWSDAFAAAVPVLAAARLTNATQIPALERWRDVENLRQHLPTVAAHVSMQSTVQMSSLVQPLGTLPELTWRRPWRERNISADQLFGLHAASASTTSHTIPHADEESGWLYYFSSLDNLPEAMRAELGSELLPMMRTVFLPVAESNLWAGVGGVSSPLHYDAAHNIYCQLVGRKRFLLLPPEETSSLYAYPRLHPSTRQSQIDIRALRTAAGRFPRFERRFGGMIHSAQTSVRIADEGGAVRSRVGKGGGNGGGDGGGGEGGSEGGGEGGGTSSVRLGSPSVYEVVLRPGDRLYIPPYWWHRASVVGDESAIAVAVYSESTPMRAYRIFKGHPLPTVLLSGCKSRCYTGACCLPALRAYLRALAALPPPGGGSSTSLDESASCLIAQRCTCFPNADAYEARDGAMADEVAAWSAAREQGDGGGSSGIGDGSSGSNGSKSSGGSTGGVRPSTVAGMEPGTALIRELLDTRYLNLPADVDVADGFGPMLEGGRRRMWQRLRPPPPPLPVETFIHLRSHAWALRAGVASLPRSGDGGITPAVWRVEIGSLLEDTASFVLGVREAEAALRWSAGLL